MAEIVGYMAGIMTSIPLIPQIYKSYKTTSTKDLSLLFLIISTLGSILWIIYGLMVKDMPLIVSSCVFVLSEITLLLMKIYFDYCNTAE